MSLNAAAQHLAAHGRGPDNTLVHMSRGEVKGLQDLAMAHGGSLSINPQTGLPEAGFLSNLLPMIGGAALTAFTGGAVNPMMASMIMGGITGVASGSLSKGLMAGLGAYGGAGMMGGLMGAGNSAIAAGATNAALQSGAHTAGAAEAAFGSHGFGNAALQSPAVAATSPFTSALEGAKGLGSEAGRDAFMTNIGGGKGLMKYGMAAAAPVFAAPETTTKQPEIKGNSDPGQQYKYSPGRVEQTPDADPLGRGQAYFNPRYTPITQSESRNIYGYAGGGPVEEMSNANAIGANTGYPMADISKGAYATPYQTPISRNVLSDSADTGVNPMTGQMNFADGGVATATPMPDQYSYDPLKQMFNKIESMPSDNQPAQPTQGGQSPVMSDAAFAKQQSEGQKNLQAMQDGTMMSRIGDSLGEGLSFMAQNSPTMAMVKAITNAISGQSGSSSPGAGFGTPGATSGNAGAMGFGPSGMAKGAVGGGSGGGGASTGSGSGGGAAAMGAAGMSGTASGAAAAGAARGGLMAAYANGGSHLGDYSDGGRLLKGPGDGVSDSIPAMIGRKQPARLADGEFVVPARIVSELGNGSTEAGARKLYAMMDRVQKARGKTVGKGRVAKNSRAERFLPA